MLTAGEMKAESFVLTLGDAFNFDSDSINDGFPVLAGMGGTPVASNPTVIYGSGNDDTLHNYSVLDRFVTTVHQEAQGFTVGEFITYAQSKSSLPALKDLNLTFDGNDKVRFWEIDQAGFDDLDIYTYTSLHGAERYNFPFLYQYWNYSAQDYYDPAGKMSRNEVIDHIFENGQSEIFLMSVRSFSQRYIVIDEKYDNNDYNLESYWSACNLLDLVNSYRSKTEAITANARMAVNEIVVTVPRPVHSAQVGGLAASEWLYYNYL